MLTTLAPLYYYERQMSIPILEAVVWEKEFYILKSVVFLVTMNATLKPQGYMVGRPSPPKENRTIHCIRISTEH